MTGSEVTGLGSSVKLGVNLLEDFPEALFLRVIALGFNFVAALAAVFLVAVPDGEVIFLNDVVAIDVTPCM